MDKNTLYASDLDGTLLRRDQTISRRSREILTRFMEEGGLFTYATARSYSSTVRVTEGFLPRIPMVTYNGAFIVEPESGRPVHVEGISGEGLRLLREAALNLPMSPFIYTLIGDRERVLHVPGGENEGSAFYIRTRKGDPRFAHRGSREDLFEGDIYYCTCIGEREELQEAYETLAQVPSLRVTLQQELYRKEYWMEVMSRDATKAKALLRIRDRLHCKRMVTFGDAVNDIPMFEVSDEAYAVENAVEELRCRATGIIPPCDEDGVAQFIQEQMENP